MSDARMDPYESAVWDELAAHWLKKSEPRAWVPEKPRQVARSTGDAARRAGAVASDRVPQSVKDKGAIVVEKALVPTLHAAVRLVEFAGDATSQMLDPETVMEFHRSKGRDVERLGDLRGLPLRDLDEFSRHSVTKWRSIGVVEGGVLGLLATVPYAGGALAISADVLVVNVLSTAIATQTCFAYGFDPEDPRYHAIVERVVRKSMFEQAPKVGTLRQANSAAFAARGRQRWSAKLRQDEKLLAAIEKLGKSFTGRVVPVEKAAKGVPVVAIVVGAGTNAHLLGDIAAQSRRYLRTIWLAEKHGLELPHGLQGP